MLLRRLTLVLLAALALAACGGAPVAEQATLPAATQVPTAAPPSRETIAPPPTQPPTLEATALPPTEPPAPTQAPAPTEPVAPTQAPAPTEPVAPTQAPPTQAPAASSGGEILFLRKGALIAFDTATGKERQLASSVVDFAPAPGGALIALIRAFERSVDLWSVRRDGADLKRLTDNGEALFEATPTWSPAGDAIVFAAAASEPYLRAWPDWSLWCTASAIHVLNLQSNADQTLDRGCDPALSPDGKRIAYAAPPSKPEPGIDKGPTIVNSIRLINRQGQNGWNFAKAEGPEAPPPHTGRVVYAPAWSPDGQQIVYHRFLGYQALVDLDLSEIGGSFEGQGKPIDSGAGWLLPARFAPDGRSVAITESNPGDARGFGGYDNWAVSVTVLEGSREIAMPSGPLTAAGQRADRLPRGQAAAWSPDGAALAVELPPGWKPDLAPDQPVNADGKPGEIWRWRPGSAPEALLVRDVDFASPLAWLPPAP